MYSADSMCQRMCGDQSGQQVMCTQEQQQPMEGCVCEEDYFWNGDRCVNASDCGCSYRYPDGTDVVIQVSVISY